MSISLIFIDIYSKGMAVYSTLLWLTRKESLLSSLAQDLVDNENTSAVVSSLINFTECNFPPLLILEVFICHTFDAL